MYLQSTCVTCERLTTKKHQQENKEYWAEANRKAYIKKIGRPLKRVLNRTLEDRLERARIKANNRCSRAKLAKRDDELTKLVTREAHDLRILRNRLTGIEWHVDHIIPLRGKNVSGLHVWNNLQVIPKILNLRKGAKNSFHEKW